MPYIPTRPLWFGTFFSSHSIVSYVSVLSSMSAGPDFTGSRWNLVHLTLGRKRAARQAQGGS